jgi:hypothetical protein
MRMRRKPQRCVLLVGASSWFRLFFLIVTVVVLWMCVRPHSCVVLSLQQAAEKASAMRAAAAEEQRQWVRWSAGCLYAGVC